MARGLFRMCRPKNRYKNYIAACYQKRAGGEYVLSYKSLNKLLDYAKTSSDNLGIICNIVGDKLHRSADKKRHAKTQVSVEVFKALLGGCQSSLRPNWFHMISKSYRALLLIPDTAFVDMGLSLFQVLFNLGDSGAPGGKPGGSGGGYSGSASPYDEKLMAILNQIPSLLGDAVEAMLRLLTLNTPRISLVDTLKIRFRACQCLLMLQDRGLLNKSHSAAPAFFALVLISARVPLFSDLASTLRHVLQNISSSDGGAWVKGNMQLFLDVVSAFYVELRRAISLELTENPRSSVQVQNCYNSRLLGLAIVSHGPSPHQGEVWPKEGLLTAPWNLTSLFGARQQAAQPGPPGPSAHVTGGSTRGRDSAQGESEDRRDWSAVSEGFVPLSYQDGTQAETSAQVGTPGSPRRRGAGEGGERSLNSSRRMTPKAGQGADANRPTYVPGSQEAEWTVGGDRSYSQECLNTLRAYLSVLDTVLARYTAGGVDYQAYGEERVMNGDVSAEDASSALSAEALRAAEARDARRIPKPTYGILLRADVEDALAGFLKKGFIFVLDCLKENVCQTFPLTHLAGLYHWLQVNCLVSPTLALIGYSSIADDLRAYRNSTQGGKAPSGIFRSAFGAAQQARTAGSSLQFQYMSMSVMTHQPFTVFELVLGLQRATNMSSINKLQHLKELMSCCAESDAVSASPLAAHLLSSNLPSKTYLATLNEMLGINQIIGVQILSERSQNPDSSRELARIMLRRAYKLMMAMRTYAETFDVAASPEARSQAQISIVFTMNSVYAQLSEIVINGLLNLGVRSHAALDSAGPLGPAVAAAAAAAANPARPAPLGRTEAGPPTLALDSSLADRSSQPSDGCPVIQGTTIPSRPPTRRRRGREPEEERGGRPAAGDWGAEGPQGGLLSGQPPQLPGEAGEQTRSSSRYSSRHGSFTAQPPGPQGRRPRPGAAEALPAPGGRAGGRAQDSEESSIGAYDGKGPWPAEPAVPGTPGGQAGQGAPGTPRRGQTPGTPDPEEDAMGVIGASSTPRAARPSEGFARLDADAHSAKRGSRRLNLQLDLGLHAALSDAHRDSPVDYLLYQQLSPTTGGGQGAPFEKGLSEADVLNLIMSKLNRGKLFTLCDRISNKIAREDAALAVLTIEKVLADLYVTSEASRSLYLCRAKQGKVGTATAIDKRLVLLALGDGYASMCMLPAAGFYLAMYAFLLHCAIADMSPIAWTHMVELAAVSLSGQPVRLLGGSAEAGSGERRQGMMAPADSLIYEHFGLYAFAINVGAAQASLEPAFKQAPPPPGPAAKRLFGELTMALFNSVPMSTHIRTAFQARYSSIAVPRPTELYMLHLLAYMPAFESQDDAWDAVRALSLFASLCASGGAQGPQGPQEEQDEGRHLVLRVALFFLFLSTRQPYSTAALGASLLLLFRHCSASGLAGEREAMVLATLRREGFSAAETRLMERLLPLEYLTDMLTVFADELLGQRLPWTEENVRAAGDGSVDFRSFVDSEHFSAGPGSPGAPGGPAAPKSTSSLLSGAGGNLRDSSSLLVASAEAVGTAGTAGGSGAEDDASRLMTLRHNTMTLATLGPRPRGFSGVLDVQGSTSTASLLGTRTPGAPKPLNRMLSSCDLTRTADQIVATLRPGKHASRPDATPSPNGSVRAESPVEAPRPAVPLARRRSMMPRVPLAGSRLSDAGLVERGEHTGADAGGRSAREWGAHSTADLAPVSGAGGALSFAPSAPSAGAGGSGANAGGSQGSTGSAAGSATGSAAGSATNSGLAGQSQEAGGSRGTPTSGTSGHFDLALNTSAQYAEEEQLDLELGAGPAIPRIPALGAIVEGLEEPEAGAEADAGAVSAVPGLSGISRLPVALEDSEDAGTPADPRNPSGPAPDGPALAPQPQATPRLLSTKLEPSESRALQDLLPGLQSTPVDSSSSGEGAPPVSLSGVGDNRTDTEEGPQRLALAGSHTDGGDDTSTTQSRTSSKQWSRSRQHRGYRLPAKRERSQAALQGPPAAAQFGVPEVFAQALDRFVMACYIPEAANDPLAYLALICCCLQPGNRGPFPTSDPDELLGKKQFDALEDELSALTSLWVAYQFIAQTEDSFISEVFEARERALEGLAPGASGSAPGSSTQEALKGVHSGPAGERGAVMISQRFYAFISSFWGEEI